ncbi:MAG TPA: DUF4351 domain-containing protein [Kofleriaceae bacterium]
MLVVGIAGGRPSSDVTLGDVVVSTRIHDFTVEARKAGEPPAYAVTGGPIDKALAALVANLPAREDELGDWTAGLQAQPPVSWTQDGQLYGPPDWQRELRDMLERHHSPQATPRARVRRWPDRVERSAGEGSGAADPLAPDRAQPARDRDGVRRLAAPLLVHFKLGTGDHATDPEDDMSAEIRAWFEDYKQKLRAEANTEGREEGRKEGIKNGIKEGHRTLLLRLLHARFGELPEAVVARIEAADIADLERWGVRVLGAQTLDEVLDDPS